jgi:mannose-6-phosphate isomerase-like protein (cupin superfamily)
MIGWVGDIEEAAEENTTFRTVLSTGRHAQLTVMSLAPGEEIGREAHPDRDQFLCVEQGQGRVELGLAADAVDESHEVEDDWGILVPAGVWHNLVNTGDTELKLFSLYAPPEHPDGTVHRTKADADAAEAAHEQPREGEAGAAGAAAEAGGGRLLVATGAVVADVNAIPPLVRGLVDAATAVFVITPILPSRLEWLVSDTDRARHQADERLNAVLGQFDEIHVPAEGRVGDETPLTALDDAVRDFGPDHILLALRGAEHAGWQRHGLVDRIRERFGVPITLFEIDGGG